MSVHLDENDFRSPKLGAGFPLFDEVNVPCGLKLGSWLARRCGAFQFSDSWSTFVELQTEPSYRANIADLKKNIQPSA